MSRNKSEISRKSQIKRKTSSLEYIFLTSRSAVYLKNESKAGLNNNIKPAGEYLTYTLRYEVQEIRSSN